MEISMTEPNFFGKTLFQENWPKMVKNGPKWFSLKIYSLILSENGEEWKYLWPLNILQKLHVLEKCGSQVMAKNAVS